MYRGAPGHATTKYPWFYMDSINHRENATSIGWFAWLLQVQEQAERIAASLL